MLQGHYFGYGLDPFHLESHHAKFQLNLLRNGRDIVTAQAKPNPQLSQIRLGLELGNASEYTPFTTTTETLNSLYLSHFLID